MVLMNPSVQSYFAEFRCRLKDCNTRASTGSGDGRQQAANTCSADADVKVCTRRFLAS